jgi:hypothetical protein
MTWLRTMGTLTAAAVCVGCATTPEELACDRSCLIELGRGVASGETELAADVRVTENGAELPLADTWLGRARNVDIHGEYADAAAGAVIIIGTGDDSDGRPSLFGLRLKHLEQTTEAELIVTHEGEVSLFPPAIPLARQPLFAEVVPADARTPRARMIELANAYFDGIEVDSGANVPVTDDCNRIENGVQTTNTERFNDIKCNSLEPFDYIPEVRERRFPIVDEERGVTAALVAFYIPGGDYERIVDGMTTTRHYDPRSLFLIEGFKIERGTIRLIEATMRNMPLGTSMGWSASSE